MKLTYKQIVESMDDGAFDNFTNCPLPFALQLKLKPLGTELRRAFQHYLEVEQNLLKEHGMFDEESQSMSLKDVGVETQKKFNEAVREMRETKSEVTIETRIPLSDIEHSIGNVPAKIFALDWLIEFPEFAETKSFDFAA